MDLTRRIGFLVLLGAALLLPAIVGDPARARPDLATTLRLDLNRTRGRLGAASDRWAAFAIRDVLVADSALRLVPPGEVRFLPRGFKAGADTSAVAQALASLWASLRPDIRGTPAVLFVYPDTAFLEANYQGTLFLEAGGREVCVGVVPTRLGGPTGGAFVVHRWSNERSLSPCAFHAAFGPPGPHIRRWLVSRRYTMARSLTWLAGVREPRARPWDYEVERLGLPRVQTTLPRWLVGVWGQYLAPPYWMGKDALHCLTGDDASCLRTVIDTALIGRTGGWPREATGRAPALGGEPPPSMATARLVGGHYLSDLIADMGRERFQRFWRSELPLAEAFRESFGTGMAEWTGRWARETWAQTWEAREGRSEVSLGVTMRPAAPLVVALWSGLLLALIGTRAMRREFV